MFLIQQDSSSIYWLSDDVVFLPADRSMDSERSLHKLFQLLILTPLWWGHRTDMATKE